MADTNNHRVQLFHPNGMFAYQVGSGVSGHGPDDFMLLADVAFGPGGLLAVVDSYISRVDVFNPPPVAPSVMPSGSHSFTAAAPSVMPSGSHSFTGAALAFEFGSIGSNPGHLMAPSNVAFGPGGLMAVADTGNHRVQVFNSDGTFAFAFGMLGDGPGEFLLA